MVHVPGFFSLLWRIVEPMLSPNTRRKIRLLRNQSVSISQCLFFHLPTLVRAACAKVLCFGRLKVSLAFACVIK